MHLVEGMVDWPWTLGGFVVTGGLVYHASRRLDPDRIPKAAVLTSTFFGASLIHLPPVLGVSIHLMLNGLLGVVLGRVTPLAILVAVTLQAILFGHGHITTIGLNTCMFAIPGLLAWLVFRPASRGGAGRAVLFGFLAGAVGVSGAGLIFAALLFLSGSEHGLFAPALLLAHIPLAFLEGAVVSATAAYLARVKPELIGMNAVAGRARDVGLVLVALGLFAFPSPAYAHKLKIDHRIDGQTVHLEVYYSDGTPVEGAVIKVYEAASGALLHEGRTEVGGAYAFRPERPVDLDVVAITDHRATLRIPASALSAAAVPGTPIQAAEPPRPRAEETPWLALVAGVALIAGLFALTMAFGLARRVRALEKQREEADRDSG